ncbi:Uncharacterized protein HSBGL_0865 [Halapricum desulfuricans]|uniref:Uncharacterized protein n=1 Tax=Halapricum desulfuricans TaxID=2841257 RepID=A0A897NIN1_9EURY|nr:hypothetical protein [Halapricum desulfuricans]QSG11295.1 Uncharacterized protein HSBGL_0865 [Halapricum desulfuricans]
MALLTALIVVSLFTGGAVAQDLDNATDPITDGTETPTPDAGESYERIDNATRLISASYDSESGMATVVIESDIPQKIVLTDAGAFVEGGEVDQRSVVVTPGEQVNISMPVTEADGFVGVSISTQKTLYAVPLESVDTVQWFDSESTWQTVQVAAFGGASGVLVVAALLAYRLRNGGTERTERIA